jgi:lysozyme
MKVSQQGLKLTEASEGCRLKAYQDTGGVWTIGYGHTNGVRPNQVITQEVAEHLLQLDQQTAENCVNKFALPCTQGQFDALVDFVFNVGPSQFLSSHLYKYHKAGEYDKAAAEFPKWKYDNGKVIQGLVTRRLAERALYSRQEPAEDHQQTDVPERSASSAVGSVLASQETGVVQSSPVQPVPTSNTVPASNNAQSVFEFRFGVLLRKLQGIASQLVH